MTKDPRVYLVHVLECAAKIRQYIASGEDAFQRESIIQDAVIRNFDVIGKPSNACPMTTETVILISHGDSWQDFATF